MDVHRDFCEIAIAEGGRVRSAGRIKTRVAELELFARSLGQDDQVALESTSGAMKVAQLIEPHVARVVIANTRKLAAISQAKAKTDSLDAQTLARLLASGYLEEVWRPDEETRVLRRLTARRSRLVRARTRAKNEIHGVLGRNLCERPPFSDCFGKAGRRWLAGVELPADERLTLDGCLRQVDFLDEEIGALDRLIAERALADPQIQRLMTVPGVNVQTAAVFVASVGDARRFASPRQLVSYLGLDPRVRQSGNDLARHGRISKAGPSETRHVLGEVAWKVAITPGPLKAFFERIRARRGAQIAATATARKLAVIFWHLLVREEDYAFQRPAMTRQKLRSLELLLRRSAAEGPRRRRRQLQEPEGARGRARALTPGRNRLPTPGQRLAGNRPEQEGCGRDTGARISKALEGQSRAADSLSPKVCASLPSVTRTQSPALQRRTPSAT
jgi:transposase